MKRNGTASGSRALASLLFACAFAATGSGISACAQRTTAAAKAERGRFDVDPRAKLEADLVERIRASPSGYFRYVNRPFANAVCARFRAEIPELPIVNLHGDAHLGQYAITDTGRGLTDFDDAASGPAVLDLVRFSASLVLTCHERGWKNAVDAVIGKFLAGYRAALEDPTLAAREPRIVKRVRAGFAFDATRYFAWVKSITEPLASDEEPPIRAALEPYFQASLAVDPKLGRDYFEIREISRSRIGIGSARLRKYMARIRGPSDAPDDDDVLELKEIGDLSGIACLTRAAMLAPKRPVVAQERIAYEPYRLVGSLVIDDKEFWVHAWAKSYQEISASDVPSVEELSEIAFDVGVQLGLGHPKRLTPPHDRDARCATIEFLSAHDAKVRSAAKSIATEVEAAWARFKSER